MTEQTALSGRVTSWLRHMWDRIVHPIWFVTCNQCGAEFASGRRFRTEADADAAARAAGWYVDGDDMLCPPCARQPAREAAPW